MLLCEGNFLLLGLKLDFLHSYTSHTFRCRLGSMLCHRLASFPWIFTSVDTVWMPVNLTLYFLSFSLSCFAHSCCQVLRGGSSPLLPHLCSLSSPEGLAEKKCMGLHCVYVLGFDHTALVCVDTWISVESALYISAHVRHSLTAAIKVSGFISGKYI